MWLWFTLYLRFCILILYRQLLGSKELALLIHDLMHNLHTL